MHIYITHTHTPFQLIFKWCMCNYFKQSSIWIKVTRVFHHFSNHHYKTTSTHHSFFSLCFYVLFFFLSPHEKHSWKWCAGNKVKKKITFSYLNWTYQGGCYSINILPSFPSSSKRLEKKLGKFILKFSMCTWLFPSNKDIFK